MAQTPAQRQANLRARKKGLPEPFAKTVVVPKEEAKAREDQHKIDYDWALAQDATGNFYKSECRSCVDLLAIYHGANILDKESEDDEDEMAEKKKKAKKENRPDPSKQKITIRAIEWNGIKLEPNCDFEFRKHKEVDEIVSLQRWLDLRDKARKDLLWLGRLLGKGLFHSVHQYICDQFVQKNFDGLYFPGYGIDDFHEMIAAQKRHANVGSDVMDGVVVECREVILLESRGAYKSTVDGIDAVQWLINCPDIRIMLMTAFRSLSKKFLKEIKRYFYLAKRAEPTAFHLLFPEFILYGRDGISDSPMTCPARNVWSKETSLWQTSSESSSTGDHCDILKLDDIVDPKNSATVEQRADLKYLADSYKNDNRDPWGFIDVCGTRYFTDDYYGTRTQPNKETKRVAPVRWSCRGCWTLSPEDQKLYLAGALTLNDIIKEKRATLTFPYKLGWSKLRDILDEKDERNFKNQQLNEATDAKTDDLYINHFDRDILRAHSYARSAAPTEMEIIQTWDIAYGDRKTSDFSVGATLGVYKDKTGQLGLVVIEVIYDKWKASELPFHMLAFYEKHRPTKVYIEEANGVQFLMGNIKNMAQLRGSDIQAHIRLRPVSVKPNAKRDRIKDLEFLLGHERLWFVNGAWIDEMFKQLSEYTGTKSTTYRKDDIPDALSFATEHLPPTALMHSPDPKLVEEENEKRTRKAQLDAQYSAMFQGNMPGHITTGRAWRNSSTTPNEPSPPVTPEGPPVNPRRQALQQLAGRILPKAMRY